MPVTTKPLRIKKLKKNTSAKKVVAQEESKPSAHLPLPGQMDLPIMEEQAQDQFEESGRRIKAIARAFRVKFSDLGKSRKLTATQAAGLTANANVDPNQLRMTKILYTRHPALDALSTAKTKMVDFWQLCTLPYPSEKGVRLFPVRGETEEEHQAEVREFIDKMSDYISDFRGAINKLAEDWSEVMQNCKDKLRDFHDDSNYPTASELQGLIGVEFEPFNFELPEYLKSVAPAEYRRQVEALNRKFTDVAEKQAELLEEAMAGGLQKMVSSIKGWADGKQRTFKDSVIGNVLDAINEYKTKIEPFGIMNGRQIGAQFDELHALLTGVGGDASAVASSLRKDGAQREFVLGRAEELFENILGMSSEKTRRKIVRPVETPSPVEPVEVAT